MEPCAYVIEAEGAVDSNCSLCFRSQVSRVPALHRANSNSDKLSQCHPAVLTEPESSKPERTSLIVVVTDQNERRWLTSPSWNKEY